MCTRNSTAVVRCALSLSEQDAAGLTSLGSRCFHNAIVRLPARVQINHTIIPLSTKEKKKAQFTLRHTSVSTAPEGTKVKILEVYIFKSPLHYTKYTFPNHRELFSEITIYLEPIFMKQLQADWK